MRGRTVIVFRHRLARSMYFDKFVIFSAAHGPQAHVVCDIRLSHFFKKSTSQCLGGTKKICFNDAVRQSGLVLSIFTISPTNAYYHGRLQYFSTDKTEFVISCFRNTSRNCTLFRSRSLWLFFPQIHDPIEFLACEMKQSKVVQA